jgi:hypothetical protein
MTASLGASLLVILMFFTGLGVMLTLAVHMESTLQRPQSRHRRPGVPAMSPIRRTDAPVESHHART